MEVMIPFAEWNELTDLISSLSKLHKEHKSLIYGDYKSIALTNRQLIYQREFEGEQIWIAINAEEQEYQVYFNDLGNRGVTDLLSGEEIFLKDSFRLSPFSFYIWKLG